MAVFIKKERLGSGAAPRVVRNPTLASLPAFQKVQQQYEEVAARKAEVRKQAWDGNAEVQHRRAMTQEERSRGAIDKVAKNLKELADQQQGTETSFEEARERAVRIARKTDRQADGE